MTGLPGTEKHAWLAITMTIGFTAAVGCEGLPLSGEDGSIEEESREIRNGDIVDGGKWGSVMIGQSVGVGCSGTMLTNRWAISAHHCFFNARGEPLAEKWIVQYGGTRKNPVQAIEAKRVIAHPINTASINSEITRDRRGVDVVLIELTSPLAPIEGSWNYVRPLLRGPSSILKDRIIRCAGWGGYDDMGSWSQNLREAEITVRDVAIALVEDPGRTGRMIHAGDRAYYGRNSRGQIPMPGDSGCGCYFLQDGRWVLAVVNGGGNSNDAFGAVMGDDVVRNFIASYISDYATSERLRPAASSWPDRLDLYWRDGAGKVRHKWYPHRNGWSGEEIIDASMTSAPAAFSRAPGGFDVFWRGTDFHLKHKWYPFNSQWSWEQDLGGTLLSAPAGVAVGADEMQVYWRGLDNTLRRRRYTTGSDWHRAQTVDTGGDLVASAPTVTIRNDGIIDVFWRGTDSRLKHVWYTSASARVSHVEDLGGSVASDPAATYRSSGILDVFWQDPNGRLKHRWYPHNGGWSWEQDLGTGLETGPAVSSRGPDRLDVYYRDTGHRIRHIWYPHNGDWSSHAGSSAEDLGGHTSP